MAADEKTADYGESDIEAKAMNGAAAGAKAEASSPVAGEDAAAATGTTETDVAQNIRDRAVRETERTAKG